ncbi:MAG: hypothetical protein WBK76_05000 [Candidatus Saccharimonadales bacterium]
MLDHHIQKSIVYDLAFAESLRFSDLKPDDMENKAFTYHLKKVVKAGLVVKQEDGTYSLTMKGRRVGKGALKKESRLLDRAYSILLLAVRNIETDEWLLYKRQTQPLLGLTGFMQAQPVAEADASRTAQETCLEQTGIQTEFTVQGHGYFRVYRKGELESFIHFTLLLGESPSGQLHETAESVGYFWQRTPNFAHPDMLPNMQTLHKMCEAAPGSFVEQTFEL